ncbi:MAG: CvpA family protein, partial [Burkholderiaceae bacterium]
TGWDYFIIATLLISVVLGLLRGMVRTVFALAGWVAALIGAPMLTPPLLAATGWTLHPLFITVLLFFVILVVVRLLGNALARVLAKVGLGALDRSLGGMLGVVRAAIIVVLAALVGRYIGADQQPAWQQATLRPVLDEMVAQVEPLLPRRMPMPSPDLLPAPGTIPAPGTFPAPGAPGATDGGEAGGGSTGGGAARGKAVAI